MQVNYGQIEQFFRHKKKGLTIILSNFNTFSYQETVLSL